MKNLLQNTFKLIIAAICISASWLGAHRIYSTKIDMRRWGDASLQANIEKSSDGKVVLIGDCTISPYYDTAKKEPKLKVIGFGGSEIEEWYFVVNHHLNDLKKAEKLVIGTSHPKRFSLWQTNHIKYHTKFMSWNDLYRFIVVDQRVDGPEALRLTLTKILPSYRTGQDNRYNIMDRILPNQHQWYTARLSSHNRELDASFKRRHDHIKLPPYIERLWNEKFAKRNIASENQWHYFEETIRLTEPFKDRVVYLITPRTERMRTKQYLAEKMEFLNKCKELGVNCLDMSEAVSEAEFGENNDGLHIMGYENLDRFYYRLQAKLLK